VSNDTELTREQLSELKSILLAQRQILLNQPQNDLTIDPSDLKDAMDAIAASADQFLSVKLETRKHTYLKKIMNALTKVSDGTYGICEDCSGDIGYNRLKARPTACLCIYCKEDREKEKKKLKIINTADLPSDGE